MNMLKCLNILCHNLFDFTLIYNGKILLFRLNLEADVHSYLTIFFLQFFWR